MIRIIGGIYKGKRLKRVPSPIVRPMPDRLKEALFNILQADIKDSSFLDGFSGTGSVGIEALSRGATKVVFIEDYPPAVKVIKMNLAKCGAEAKARILHQEFNRAIIQLSKEKAQFDLIFLDPPYRLLEERNPLKILKKRGILKPQGKVILRHYFKIKPQKNYFDLKRIVSIGDDRLSFFQ